ncbi:MAG: hypothetical protein WD231_00835 [Candidatus Woykebacteria bacterium]
MNQKGQALVTILIVIAMTTLATSIALVSTSFAQNVGRATQTEIIHYAAESGVEQALIKLLRDPSYTGETFVTPDGASVQVAVPLSPNPRLIASVATKNNLKRRVEVSVTISNNILTTTSWKETP